MVLRRLGLGPPPTSGGRLATRSGRRQDQRWSRASLTSLLVLPQPQRCSGDVTDGSARAVGRRLEERCRSTLHPGASQHVHPFGCTGGPTLHGSIHLPTVRAGGVLDPLAVTRDVRRWSRGRDELTSGGLVPAHARQGSGQLAEDQRRRFRVSPTWRRARADAQSRATASSTRWTSSPATPSGVEHPAPGRGPLAAPESCSTVWSVGGALPGARRTDEARGGPERIDLVQGDIRTCCNTGNTSSTTTATRAAAVA